MKSDRLKRSFFEAPTLIVAERLLGKELVFNDCSVMITETEAYIGEKDPACHAARGMTARNQIMYGKSGVSYVYFIYGMYYCLNIVTEKEGIPAAVLIRGGKPLKGLETMKKRRKSDNIFTLASGPGRLCHALGIDRSQNGIDLTTSSNFFVRDRSFKISTPEKTPRIGISKGKEFLWRFIIK